MAKTTTRPSSEGPERLLRAQAASALPEEESMSRCARCGAPADMAPLDAFKAGVTPSALGYEAHQYPHQALSLIMQALPICRPCLGWLHMDLWDRRRVLDFIGHMVATELERRHLDPAPRTRYGATERVRWQRGRDACLRCGSWDGVAIISALALGLSYEDLGLDAGSSADLGDCLAVTVLPICTRCLDLLDHLERVPGHLPTERERKAAFVRDLIEQRRRRRRYVPGRR